MSVPELRIGFHFSTFGVCLCDKGFGRMFAFSLCMGSGEFGPSAPGPG